MPFQDLLAHFKPLWQYKFERDVNRLRIEHKSPFLNCPMTNFMDSRLDNGAISLTSHTDMSWFRDSPDIDTDTRDQDVRKFLKILFKGALVKEHRLGDLQHVGCWQVYPPPQSSSTIARELFRFRSFRVIIELDHSVGDVPIQ